MENNQDKVFSRCCGITSLVFSILSILLIKFIVISVIFAVISIIFGLFSKRCQDGIGKAGLIIGIISISITIILFILLNVLEIPSLFMIPSWY